MIMASVLIGCAPPGGVRKIDAPLSSEYVQIVSVSSTLVEVESSGRLVKAAAPEGVCIPPDSIQTRDRTAFMIMNDCGETRLSGVLTLSIGATPHRLGPEGLEQILRSPDGIAGLGFASAGGEAVTLLDAVVSDGAVITVLRDESGAGPAFAGDVLCRAFTELNGRLAAITLMSLRDKPTDPDRMREDLGRVIAKLREANA